ncbi:MAG: glutamine synthetase [Clostridia bacterium]|nr:glutamine synthetase [Clostridia bacterium]
MRTKQEIINLVKEEDVKFIRLQFTDMLGRMKNIAITESRLQDALDNECIVDASTIDGFSDSANTDLCLCPDLDTFTIFPWRPHQGKVARLICDLRTVDGKEVSCDPRLVLKKVIDEAQKEGFIFEVGPECEFFLFKTDDNGNPTMEPHDNAGYFDLAPLDNGENCRRDICLTLEQMGYGIEASHHESAKGQHEIIFRHGNALTTADRLITFKNVVKTLATRHGLHATFMPKPFADGNGSGMHLTMSLFDKEGNNVFYDNSDPSKLSKTGYKFMAGILAHTREMACITNPTVNSYKRFIPGFNAPCYISWSEHNNSLLVRIPHCTKEGNSAIELRSPDNTANPYLAIAGILKAGIMGIKNDYKLPTGIDINLHTLKQSERDALGVKSLPISLNEAIKIAKDSEFITELLGEELKDKYLAVKRQEYDSYRKSISQWEIDNYLNLY